MSSLKWRSKRHISFCRFYYNIRLRQLRREWRKKRWFDSKVSSHKCTNNDNKKAFNKWNLDVSEHAKCFIWTSALKIVNCVTFIWWNLWITTFNSKKNNVRYSFAIFCAFSFVFFSHFFLSIASSNQFSSVFLPQNFYSLCFLLRNEMGKMGKKSLRKK